MKKGGKSSKATFFMKLVKSGVILDGVYDNFEGTTENLINFNELSTPSEYLSFVNDLKGSYD